MNSVNNSLIFLNWSKDGSKREVSPIFKGMNQHLIPTQKIFTESNDTNNIDNEYINSLDNNETIYNVLDYIDDNSIGIISKNMKLSNEEVKNILNNSKFTDSIINSSGINKYKILYERFGWPRNQNVCDTIIVTIKLNRELFWQKKVLNKMESNNNSDITHKQNNNTNSLVQQPLFLSYQNIDPSKSIMKDKLVGQNEKISQRDLIVQTSKNPYLDNNYLEHLSNQESFLKPQDSNFST